MCVGSNKSPPWGGWEGRRLEADTSRSLNRRQIRLQCVHGRRCDSL